MKKTISYLSATLLAVVLISSCHKDDDNNQGCSLDLTSTASADGIVVYSVTVASGAGIASSVTYKGTSGDVTVKSPSLPFHVSIDKKKNDAIYIIADVTVDNGGQVLVGYAFTANGGGDIDQSTRTCPQ